MTRLAPDLFAGRRYSDLVEIGLSRLPGITPGWTDYNAHDPGITLMELLAATAEAQLYSLSRMRRDERAAYAAMMGIAPMGTSAASGLIWPYPADPAASAAKLVEALVIEPDDKARIAETDAPLFGPEARLLWIPAAIAMLETRLADGRRIDRLPGSRRGAAFAPLGDGDGRGAVLRIGLVAMGWAPLFPAGRPDDALLAVGVRADNGPRAADTEAVSPDAPRLTANLITSEGVFALPVHRDGSDAMARSGAILLDLGAVAGEPREAVLELSAPQGVDRPPRLTRVDVNVVPVVQREAIEERHDGNGLPDQTFDLEQTGIAFVAGAAPLAVTVASDRSNDDWGIVDRLADCGPEDRVFAFDAATGRVCFGNGLNGAIPPENTAIVARYTITAGAAGNLGANRKWTLGGFPGTFGVNPDRFSGGTDAPGSDDQRHAARKVLRDEHPLVSADDFVAAALALGELEVGRAWVVPSSSLPGVMPLLAMRARGPEGEPATAPETPRWLEAVRAALSPRALLGGRLQVIAPTYVDFTVAMRVEIAAGLDPDRVAKAVYRALAARLTLVGTTPAKPVRGFGQPVSTRDLGAWVRVLPEVLAVGDVAIRPSVGGTVATLDLPRVGLPRIDFAGSAIRVVRAGAARPS